LSPLLQNTLVVSLILGFAAMEFATRRYQRTVRANANDTKLELLMFVSLIAVAQPVALLGADQLCGWLMPQQRGAWSELPWWAMFGIFLLADDLTQYGWHRVSHTPLLWPLHRAHHSAKYMSIRITFRNNFFYYLLMPGLWLAGVLFYLGFGKVYTIYFVLKIAVIIGAHSAWRWDEPLYRVRALRALMWLLERTISTPATHWAHHALTNADGVGHYKGNFGNLLFVWDVLFGTARITRRYPAAVGLQDDLLFGEEHWAHQMFYPLAQSQREHSALRPGGRPYEEATGSAATPPAATGSA
jgi:sterol desaturase/sphingolipid hydroxylase (fatty acid hydroxylase superfamily)